MAKLAFLPLVYLLSFPHSTHGYGSGAPPSQCVSLVPGHGLTPKDNSNTPYVVKLNSLQLKPGASAEVELTHDGSEKHFKGYLVQARSVSDDSVTGTFEIVSDDAQYVQCGEVPRSAVTHVFSESKESIKLNWIPPTNFSGKVEIVATFVQDYANYWVKVPSKTFEILESEPESEPESELESGQESESKPESLSEEPDKSACELLDRLEASTRQMEAQLKIQRTWIQNLKSGSNMKCAAQKASTVLVDSAVDPSVHLARFSGEILKSDQTLALPSSLAIGWMNFIEGDDVRDGTAWNWTGGVSRYNNSHFSLDMELTEDEFARNITTSPKIIERWTETLKNNPKVEEQFKNFKFAMGQIFGVYNNDNPSPVNGNDGSLGIRSKGPRNETALADMYAVFYKQGTLDEFAINNHGRKKKVFQACKWYSKLPEGFSCGRGAPVDESCGSFERFIPIKCSEIVVKVAQRFCKREEINLEDPKPDCHLYVNWT
eukprot:GFUD01006966.1.p1 GENE.GFUD01006966.1~~GFUD01006966.1.p1  ORF type:complete len:488 (+),score=117.33 GFUD01006966.1:135-1598(+)